TKGESERCKAFCCLLLAVGYWLLAIGYWLLAICCWLFAVCCWLLAVIRFLSLSGSRRVNSILFNTFNRSIFSTYRAWRPSKKLRSSIDLIPVYMKKTLFHFCLLFLFISIGLPSSGQEALSSDSLQISLITSGPGNDLYTAFGHTAIRVQDFSSGGDFV